MEILVARFARWVVGAYRGSNTLKLLDIGGLDKLAVAMERRRIRWAAGMYGSLEEGLAEPILRKNMEQHTILQ